MQNQLPSCRLRFRRTGGTSLPSPRMIVARLAARDRGALVSHGGLALVDAARPQPVPRHARDQPRLTPIYALALSIVCGLVGGYVDVAMIVLKRCFWFGPKNYGNGSDFPWSIPVGHAVLLLIPGVALATVCWIRPRPMSLRGHLALCHVRALVGLAAVAVLQRCQSFAGLGTGLAVERSRRDPLPTPTAGAIRRRGSFGSPGGAGRLVVGLACCAGISRGRQDCRQPLPTLATSCSLFGTRFVPAV